jgi:hypothetical protein
MSPASYELLGHVFRGLLGILAAIIVTALTLYLLKILPIISLKYFGANISVQVPLASGLYYLFIFTAILNLIIAVTLIPMKRIPFDRAGRELTISGHGDPHLFFALLEEACRLLNARRLPERRPIRLENDNDSAEKGVLIESYPTLLTTMSRPMGYVCLPVIIILFAMGFSKLIQFRIPTDSMSWTTFLSDLAPLIIYKIILAFAIIMVGLHFSEWARKLLGICKFQSWAVFSKIKTPDKQGAQSGAAQSGSFLRRKDGPGDQINWRASHGVDSEFIDWAKDPDSTRAFDVEVFWAEVISESADPESPRFVTLIHRTSALDAIMVRVLQLPFRVRLHAQSLQPIVASHRIQAAVPKKQGPSEAKTATEPETS